MLIEEMRPVLGSNHIAPTVPDAARWEVQVDHDELGRVSHLSLKSSFGELHYGARPYPCWAFREAGGGGAVTMPYTRTPDGKLLIGLLLEDRPNMGGQRWCAVGGFVDPGETHLDASIREATEEMGIVVPPVLPMEGLPINSNRQFFDADPERGEGLRSYKMEIPYAWLDPREDGGFVMKPGIQVGIKKPENLAFFPAKQAARMTDDALALAGITRLLVEDLE